MPRVFSRSWCSPSSSVRRSSTGSQRSPSSSGSDHVPNATGAGCARGRYPVGAEISSGLVTCGFGRAAAWCDGSPELRDQPASSRCWGCPNTFGDRPTGDSGSNCFAVFVSLAIRSMEGAPASLGRRAGSRRIRLGRAKRLLSTPGRVFGTHRFAVGSGRSTAATSAACKASVAKTRSARAKWGRHVVASRPTFGPDEASLLAL
jgi:hypothetical protein